MSNAIGHRLTTVTLQSAGEGWLATPLRNPPSLPYQPVSDFPALLGAADVLAALLENDAREFTGPSEVSSSLPAGRAFIPSAPPGNFSAKNVPEADGGVSAPAGGPEPFIGAAHRLYENPVVRQSLSAAGRRYAAATFKAHALTNDFEQASISDPPRFRC